MGNFSDNIIGLTRYFNKIILYMITFTYTFNELFYMLRLNHIILINKNTHYVIPPCIEFRVVRPKSNLGDAHYLRWICIFAKFKNISMYNYIIFSLFFYVK